MAVGAPAIVGGGATPHWTTTTTFPSKSSSTTSPSTPATSTRVANVLCIVIPLVILGGLLAAGAVWFRRRRRLRRLAAKSRSSVFVQEEGESFGFRFALFDVKSDAETQSNRSPTDPARILFELVVVLPPGRQQIKHDVRTGRHKYSLRTRTSAVTLTTTYLSPSCLSTLSAEELSRRRD